MKSFWSGHINLSDLYNEYIEKKKKKVSGNRVVSYQLGIS